MTTSSQDAMSTPIWLVRNSIFFAFHLATLICLYFAGFSWWGLLVCVLMYYVRMFGITAGYHRYFSHRAFKTSRFFQFILAFIGTLALQKGVLWWASHHVDHHKYSDQEQDPHSRKLYGFWHSHVGWILTTKYAHTEWDRVKDYAKFWELRALNAWLGWMTPFVLMCCLFYFVWGFHMLVWGCFVSTIVLYHCTFFVNSLMHSWGDKVYRTIPADESRNSMLLALLTMGEGWHNNHHYYQKAAKQGFAKWWQIDLSYMILWCCEQLGIIWDVHRPSEEWVSGHPKAGCRLINCPEHSHAEQSA